MKKTVSYFIIMELAGVRSEELFFFGGSLSEDLGGTVWEVCRM